jgi:ribonuclease HII
MRPHWLAGVDEAGRGPLAGPVVAACVVLDPGRPIPGLADSKALSAARRCLLEVEIKERALAWGIGEAGPREIERDNILRATLLAMVRAVEALPRLPDEVLVDGLHCPPLPRPVRAVVRGDASVPAISAASILAKTYRDRLMIDLHARFPAYGFDAHKGYPTPDHLAALRRHGPTEAHRMSFGPVRRACGGLPASFDHDDAR